MNELPDLSRLSNAEKDKLIIYLFNLVQKLSLRIEELEARLSKDSHNSSKPPSSDGLQKPQPKSLRKSGERKPGGQVGHKGQTLSRSNNPDHVVTHTPPTHCEACQSSLAAGKVVETRQVFDLPPTRFEVTEHQCLESRCSCGAVYRGEFPAGIENSLQYGPRALAAVVNLTQHQMIPLQRTTMLMQDLFSLPISEATIIKACNDASKKLESTVAAIGKAILARPVAHVDETGFRVAGSLHWIHAFVSNGLTWLGCHPKRGSIAFKEFGLLEQYRGVLMHDGWVPYRDLDCQHALCNAHHLRELVYLHEEMQQDWAGKMIDLLLSACHSKNLTPDGVIAPQQIIEFRERYQQILCEGESANPLQNKNAKRGRTRQSKASNLLGRLRQYADEVWRFAEQPEVPFTNNRAEQAVRMPKVKQKISGGLRTFPGAQTFCSIRSYLVTMHQQGNNIFQSLIQTFQGNVPQPCFD